MKKIAGVVAGTLAIQLIVWLTASRLPGADRQGRMNSSMSEAVDLPAIGIGPSDCADSVGNAGQSFERKSERAAKFAKAQKAAADQNYKAAARLLREIVAADDRDFEAWAALGYALFLQKDNKGADRAYQRALGLRPDYPIALLNLGKLKMERRDFEAAVELLSRLVEAHPTMAEAQYQLGEAYLQVLRGSKAIVHFNESIRLDPNGMAEAHLRLAALYNAAGFKERAVAEYENFLAKRPDYSERDQLLKYIRKNKKHSLD